MSNHPIKLTSNIRMNTNRQDFKFGLPQWPHLHKELRKLKRTSATAQLAVRTPKQPYSVDASVPMADINSRMG